MNILISPLNWGIGHATRIVPIIKNLKKNHKIFLAADGAAFDFLKNYFPDIEILNAPKLQIRYSKKAWFMPAKMIFYLPRLQIFYIKNRFWVKKNAEKLKIDVIIADNRFGFFSKKTKSIFITHQLNIRIPEKLKIFSPIVQLINKKNIEKFDTCWIPDDKAINLSGKLANPGKLKTKTQFIGILSRFEKTKQPASSSTEYEIFAIISGPEPQRTIFEKKIIDLLKNINKKSLIISGKPQFLQSADISGNITLKTHISDTEFATVAKSAGIIIARSGYSTIMDLVHLKKTAILVPTPGQTEQEYLANYLHSKNLFFACKQNSLSKNSIEKFLIKKISLQDNIEKIKLTDFDFNKIL